LVACEVLCRSEIKEVLMICEYDDRVRIPFKIMPPCFQGTDDGKEFMIVNLIISFGGVKGLRKISAGVICSVLISLEQDCTGCNERCIGG
jgi:hypothetical protein